MNSDHQPQMMSRSFGIWPPPLLPGTTIAGDPMGVVFQKVPPVIFKSGALPAAAQPGRMMAWKGRKRSVADMRMTSAAAASRRFFPKKKMARFAPYAPRNTTSFIIRAKKSGGIAPLVSPSPVTPAILPTPKISPMPADMAKEEFGVDGYGSMKGLIRLRPPTHRGPATEEEEDDGSSESDLEVERRLDHDLSRFEMVYPSFGGGGCDREVADDRDGHIAQREEENLTLKERMFLMEVEMRDLRQRMQLLETKFQARDDNNNNNSKENNAGNAAKVEGLENDDGEGRGCGDVCSEKSVDGDREEERLGTPLPE